MNSISRVATFMIVTAAGVFATGCAAQSDDVVQSRVGSENGGTLEAPTTSACAEGTVDVGSEDGEVVCEAAPGEVADGPMAAATSTAHGGGGFDSSLAFHDVWGKPNFMCADLGSLSGQLQSAWYGKYRGPTNIQVYVGTCASLSNDSVRAAYKFVPGWPTFKCADLPSDTQSVWFRLGDGVRRAFLVSGNCASHAIYSGSAPPTSVP